MVSGGRERPLPYELVYGNWMWGVEIPWLPDLLADAGDSSSLVELSREAFKRQIGLLRAIAATDGRQAFQLRFMTGSNAEDPVRIYLIGRASNAVVSAESIELVLGALPAEYPTRPLGEERLAAVVDPFSGDIPTEATFAEVRRSIEPLTVIGDLDGIGDQVVLPWTWSASSLLTSIEVIRRQPGRCVLGVHVEARPPTSVLTLWLTGEMDQMAKEYNTGEQKNELVSTAYGAYQRWLRDLPNEALHLRLFLASDAPLLPGASQQVGVDLSQTFDPGKTVGTLSSHSPSTRIDQERAGLLINEMTSAPFNEPGDPHLAELQCLFGAMEANTAFRLPITPRGGLEGIATARLSTLSQGRDAADQGEGVDIGSRPGGGRVIVSLRELNQHLLVAGLPGFGKTTTLQRILLGLQQLSQPIPFLVIDPAKEDYRHLVSVLRGQGTECELITLDHNHMAFNPLAPPDGVDIRRHAGRIQAAFDTAFGLTPGWPMGALQLSRALYSMYEEAEEADRGWPTISDLYRTIRLLVRDAGWGERIASDIEASLLTRIEFLAGGPTGMAFCGDADAGIDWDRIMTRPTVIELGAFAGEERSLMFALLLAGLVSWRETHRVSGGLAHVTVLEEAHRVLSARTQSVGAEVFVEAIAELRGAGEGFVVVEQAPSLLHPGIPKLTGSKIAHRIVEEEERNIFGSSMMLDARQKDELARLATGRAVVYTATSSSPALAEIEAATHTGDQLPEVESTNSLASPGAGAASLACLGCPRPCEGSRGRAIVGELMTVASDGDLRPVEETALLVAEAYGLLSDGALPAIAAYCATAHVLAIRHADSLTRLRQRLVLAKQHAMHLPEASTGGDE